MIDHLFSAALTFCLLCAGTAAVGSRVDVALLILRQTGEKQPRVRDSQLIAQPSLHLALQSEITSKESAGTFKSSANICEQSERTLVSMTKV